MAAPVRNVAWKCPQCGKRKWLKPFEVMGRRYCSRACQYAGQRVEKPVRVKPGARLARYGIRECPSCSATFEATSPVQRYCSQACATRQAQDARRTRKPGPRACEVCGVQFTPRDYRMAGRFCSRACTYAGNKGERANSWKGGRYTNDQGYVLVTVRDHPYAQKHHGYVPEHRLVMEQQLGRYLTKGETVHHINGNRSDNRVENLQLRSGQHGKGAAYRCLDCGSHNVVAVKLHETAEA